MRKKENTQKYTGIRRAGFADHITKRRRYRMERPHFDIVASGERMKEIRRQRKISVKQVVE